MSPNRRSVPTHVLEHPNDRVQTSVEHVEHVGEVVKVTWEGAGQVVGRVDDVWEVKTKMKAYGRTHHALHVAFTTVEGQAGQVIIHLPEPGEQVMSPGGSVEGKNVPKKLVDRAWGVGLRVAQQLVPERFR